MRAKAAAARFGELYEISKADWVREVTEASNSATVVAHLYEDGIVECRVMEVCVCPRTMFVLCSLFLLYLRDCSHLRGYLKAMLSD